MSLTEDVLKRMAYLPLYDLIHTPGIQNIPRELVDRLAVLRLANHAGAIEGQPEEYTHEEMQIINDLSPYVNVDRLYLVPVFNKLVFEIDSEDAKRQAKDDAPSPEEFIATFAYGSDVEGVLTPEYDRQLRDLTASPEYEEWDQDQGQDPDRYLEYTKDVYDLIVDLASISLRKRWGPYQLINIDLEEEEKMRVYMLNPTYESFFSIFTDGFMAEQIEHIPGPSWAVAEKFVIY